MRKEAFQGGQLELLSQNDVERIHETAIRILEEVGIEVPLSEAVEIYKKGGTKVASDNQTVKYSIKKVKTCCTLLSINNSMCVDTIVTLKSIGEKDHYGSRSISHASTPFFAAPPAPPFIS